MTLPTHQQAEGRVRNGTASNLDLFIYNWEPAGKDEAMFREQLESLLSNPELTKEMIEESRPKRVDLKDCHEHPPFSQAELNRFWNPVTNQYESYSKGS